MTDFETKEYSWQSSLILPAMVVLTGILAVFGAVVFRVLIGLFHRLIYFQSGDFRQIVPFIAGWRVVLGPGIGGAVVGPFGVFLGERSQRFWGPRSNLCSSFWQGHHPKTNRIGQGCRFSDLHRLR